MQEYLDFAIEIAKYAGVVIKDNFLNDSNSIEYKIDRTPVTIADKKINSYLIAQQIKSSNIPEFFRIPRKMLDLLFCKDNNEAQSKVLLSGALSRHRYTCLTIIFVVYV